MNPAMPDLPPSIYLPIQELSDVRSMNLTTPRLQLSLTADQRPRPPPTPGIETADHRSAADD